MKNKKTGAIAAATILVVFCGAISTSAATITMSLDYVGSLDSAFNPIGTPLVDNPSSVTPSQYHQFSVSYAVAGAAANEDFQGVQFDAVLGAGFTPADFGGYIGESSPPGSAAVPPAGPLYSTNFDGGVDGNDLKRIIVIASSVAKAHNYRPGIVGSGVVGDIYLQLDLFQIIGNHTSVDLVPNGLDAWSLYVGPNPVAQSSASFGDVEAFHVTLGDIFPPVVDDFEHVADLNEVVSTTILATDADSWSGLQNPTFTPNYAGAPGAFFQPQWNPNTQQFSWNTKGSSWGTYTWEVTASNALGSDVGLISIEVGIPEPASCAMLSLAALAITSTLRRRITLA